MLRIAKFEKVSPQRFVNDWLLTFPQQSIEQAQTRTLTCTETLCRFDGSTFTASITMLPFNFNFTDYVVAEEGEILMITPRSDAAAMRRMHTDTKFG